MDDVFISPVHLVLKVDNWEIFPQKQYLLGSFWVSGPLLPSCLLTGATQRTLSKKEELFTKQSILSYCTSYEISRQKQKIRVSVLVSVQFGFRQKPKLLGFGKTETETMVFVDHYVEIWNSWKQVMHLIMTQKAMKLIMMTSNQGNKWFKFR